MNFLFTEEQEMLRRTVRTFAENEIAPEVARMEAEDRFLVELVKKMGELGLTGMVVPEKYGGTGMDFTSYIIAVHEISKVSATAGVILSVHTSVATNPILCFGTEAQKRKYVPKLARAEYIGAFALTEPEAGSDAASIRTRAVRRGDHYVINGEKVFITNGAAADVFIVFAKTDPDAGRRGISAFIVERNTPGFSIGKPERKMGLNGSGTVPLRFENALVPVENRLGDEGEGFKVAMSNLNYGRIGIAAQALGIAEAAFEHARRYAQERRQFGAPIGRQQAIAFKLADLATRIEAARLLVYRGARIVQEGEACAKEASMAKLFASQTAVKAAVEAVQIFGGYGYTKDYPVERFFRDAKVTEIYEGTSEIQRMVISKHLLS